MITSERRYKDLTVIRETVIACGPDVLKTGHGEERHTVMVERRLPDHIEIIMPNEALFLEAVAATILEESAAILGRKGRQVNSPAQQEAARVNGRKGGRPRKEKANA